MKKKKLQARFEAELGAKKEATKQFADENAKKLSTLKTEREKLEKQQTDEAKLQSEEEKKKEEQQN